MLNQPVRTNVNASPVSRRGGRRQFAICNLQFAICNRPRRAYTLVEMVLTLSVILIVSAVAWTSVKRPLAQQRLRAAADAVRTEWCHARIDAMRSGHTYTFRYSVNGDHYQLGPDNSLADFTSLVPAILSAGDEWDEDILAPPVEKVLPRGIRFLKDDSAGELAALGDDVPEESDSENDGWSQPIYFFADGTTSDAGLVLASGAHSSLKMSLRGVTGAVNVGDAVVD